uniref:Uncharacterized protein n=1 Tax=Anopheles albimanus TaxID=7167 RepID=A0A182F9Q3_ANOAL
MADDILNGVRTATSNDELEITEDIRNEVLILIEKTCWALYLSDHKSRLQLLHHELQQRYWKMVGMERHIQFLSYL